MQLHILNLLQSLLLPLAVGAVVVAGLLVVLVGRKPTRPRKQATPKTPTTPTPTPAAVAVAERPAAPAAPEATVVPASQSAAPAPATPPARPRKADLLLVDDSAVVRAKLRRLFEPAGYSLTMAPDGEAALTLLSHGSYGLLVTDLEMPRLDGVGLIRAVLADPACAGMPILAITGHDNLQSQLNALHAVAGIYRKPWVDDDLLSHVTLLVAPSLLPAELAEPA